jgi:segregation and condensation protein B
LLKAAALIAYHQPIPQSRLVELLGQKAYDYVRELAQLGMVDRRKDGNTRRLSTTRRFSEIFGCPYTDRKKVKQWFREQVKTTGLFDGMEDAAVLKEESEIDGSIQSTLPLGEEE